MTRSCKDITDCCTNWISYAKESNSDMYNTYLEMSKPWPVTCYKKEGYTRLAVNCQP